MDEYKSLASDIQSRVDLQQRNANLFIVFVSALTGYVITYWTKVGALGLVTHSQIILFLAVGPILTQAFIWRHLDHDSNIIDKAGYISTVIRPELKKLTVMPTVLSFETFLRTRRLSRIVRLSPLSLLGMDHVVMILYSGGFLALDFDLRFTDSARAGGARQLFDWLSYIGAGLFLVSLYMAIVTGLRYASLGNETGEHRPTIDSADPTASSGA